MTELQAALLSEGRDLQIDGAYGAQTERAVKETFKRASIGEKEAHKLGLDFSEASRILGLVSFFEGTNHDHILGNYDGAGLTFGVLGMTALRGGTLIEYFRRLAHANSATGHERWAEFSNPAKAVIDKAIAQKGRRAQDAVIKAAVGEKDKKKYKASQSWVKFAQWAGSLPGARGLQKRIFVEQYYDVALRHLANYGVANTLTNRVLLTDIQIQLGGIKATPSQIAKLRGIDPKGQALMMADYAAGKAAPSWRGHVVERKTGIAIGSGNYRGRDFRLSDFGLE